MATKPRTMGKYAISALWLTCAGALVMFPTGEFGRARFVELKCAPRDAFERLLPGPVNPGMENSFSMKNVAIDCFVALLWTGLVVVVTTLSSNAGGRVACEGDVVECGFSDKRKGIHAFTVREAPPVHLQQDVGLAAGCVRGKSLTPSPQARMHVF